MLRVANICCDGARDCALLGSLMVPEHPGRSLPQSRDQPGLVDAIFMQFANSKTWSEVGECCISNDSRHPIRLVRTAVVGTARNYTVPAMFFKLPRTFELLLKHKHNLCSLDSINF